LGGRYKISKRVSVNAEYFVNFDNHSFYKNPLSLGLDIETGGHVFQLLFTNSQINSDIGYLTNASGNWGKDIFSLGLIFIEFFNMKKLTSLLSLSSMIILCSCDSRTYEDISDNKPIELPVKYTADIKPIIENNCIGCHSEGSFIKPLATYEQVKNNINSILDRIQRPDGDPGKMPKGGSLSPAQINTFIKWKADGLTEN
jgi:hypothetical protein